MIVFTTLYHCWIDSFKVALVIHLQQVDGFLWSSLMKWLVMIYYWKWH